MLRDGDWLSVVMIDVDHFKAFNDSLGHLAGDRSLVRIAHVIAGSLRRAGDLVARFGGEEFAVLLPQTDAAGAALVAERLRRSVEAIEIDHPHSPSGCVTISLGAASTVPVDAASPTELLDAADAALYAAKHAGRNRAVAAGATNSGSDLAAARRALGAD